MYPSLQGAPPLLPLRTTAVAMYLVLPEELQRAMRSTRLPLLLTADAVAAQINSVWTPPCCDKKKRVIW